MLVRALALAEKGFRIFPCRPGTNRPGIKKWPELACSDPETIKFWWSKSYAKANIGVATGDDLVIIDVDTKHGDKGKASLKQLMTQGLPKTYTVTTPSGGLHLYYKIPLDTTCELGTGQVRSVTAWLPDIDLRGRGGQGVGPGSVREDGTYDVLHDVPIALLPQTIYVSMPKAKVKPQPAELGSSLGLLEGPASSSAGSLITTKESEFSELPAQIPLGSHDEQLFKYACSMRERGTPRQYAEILMRELASRCEPDPSIPLENAKALAVERAFEKLNHAWSAYEPGGARDWVEVVTADNTPVAAPARDVHNLSTALGRFVLVEAGNRVVDRVRHPAHGVFAMEEFKNSVKNIKIQVGEKKYALSGIWVGHKERQTVRDTGYSPSGEEIYSWQGEQFFNTYMGPAINSAAKELPAVDVTQLGTAIDHIKYFFPNKKDASQFISWMAFSVQNPEKRVPWSPLIVSKPGAGKGWLFMLMSKLLGSSNCIMIQPDSFNTNSAFNDYLSEKTLVCVDEMRTTKRFDMMEKLKSLITETELEINHKYGVKRKEKIFANFMCFSNHLDAAAIKDDDRRFWVYRVEADPRSSGYYSTLFDWLNTDGPVHFLKFLQQMNTSAWRYAAKPPETRARMDMIDANRSEVEILVRDAVEDRVGMFRSDIVSHIWVKDWVMMELGIDRLDSKQIFHLNQVLNDISYPIPTDRLRVSLGNQTGKASKQVRVKCIRNQEHWSSATRELLCKELERCWRLSIGEADIGPSLERVEVVNNS